MTREINHITYAGCRIQPIEGLFELTPKRLKLPGLRPERKSSRFGVAVASDHGERYSFYGLRKM